MAEHCKIKARVDGKWPEEFPLPEVPPDFYYLWAWYWELRRAARTDMGSPQPLQYSEIAYWKNLLQRNPAGRDIEYIRLLDDEFLKGSVKISKANKPNKTKR